MFFFLNNFASLLIVQVVFRRGQRGPPPRQSEPDPHGALHTHTCTAVQCEDHLYYSNNKILILIQVKHQISQMQNK